ncbi:MAG TPA: hypothetical protein VG271_14755, partial [Beijerinckiaceae bacterium]|nr:hypothetical protein [Beijerinckiaceae bacterium]
MASLDASGGVPGLRSAMQAHGGLDPANLRSLVIVGAAVEGQRLARICKAHGIGIEAVVDDDPRKSGSDIAGLSVAPVETLTGLPKSTPIVIASHRVLHIIRRLRGLGFETVVPFAMLQV